VTAEGARAIAERRTREYLALKAGQIDGRPLCCPACSVQVDAVDVPSLKARGVCARCSVVEPEAVRTVAFPRDIGDGVLADDWTDA
jgi:hypothetical protein